MNALFNGGGISAPAENDGSGVKETWLDNVVVLTASGALDLLTTPRLQDAIDVAATKAPDAILVDLSELEFLASAGMNALVAAHHKITPSARFAVVADGAATARPLKLLGIDKVVALYPAVSDALQALTHR